MHEADAFRSAFTLGEVLTFGATTLFLIKPESARGRFILAQLRAREGLKTGALPFVGRGWLIGLLSCAERTRTQTFLGRKTLVDSGDLHVSVVSVTLGGAFSRIRSAYRLLIGQPIVPKGVRLGRNVHVGTWVRFDYTLDGALIEISDDATVVSGAQILCHDASSTRRIGGTWVAPVRIGARAFIGAHAILMPGVTIGDDAIVAAGAVVTKDVESRTVVAGVPAVRIGSVDEVDRRRALDMKSKPLFEFTLYGGLHLKEDKRRQLLEAVDREGGFYFISGKTYKEYLKSIE